MQKPLLKIGYGESNQFPELGKDVEELQRLLILAGFNIDVDGKFSENVKRAVEYFQNQNGLGVDGVVGKNTWKALEEMNKFSETPVILAGFRGDLKWVHNREGHAGEAYWPRGNSGITLDPGVDLGHAKPEFIEKLYRNIIRIS